MPPVPSIAAVRLIRRSLRWPLLRLLTPGVLAFTMVVGVMSTALDLGGLARLIGGGGVLPSAAWALGLSGGWALLHARGLQTLLFGPGPLHWLARQPISWPSWSLGLVGPLLSVGTPVALLGLLQQPEQPLLGLTLWLELGACVALAAAARGRRAAGALWAAAGLLAAGAGLARSWSGLLPPVVAVGAGVLVGLGPAWLLLSGRPARAPWLPSVAPRGPLGVLVRRELLFVLRRRPAALGMVLGWAALTAPAAEALLAAGAVPVQHVSRVLALSLVLPTAVLASALGAYAAQEPAAWDPPAWPISASQRVAALVAAAAGGLLPTLAALVWASGPSAALVAATLGNLGLVAWIATRARRERLDLGSAVGGSLLAALHPLAGMLCCALGLALARRAVLQARRRPRLDPRARR